MIKTSCGYCGKTVHKIISKFEGRSKVFCNDICCTKYRATKPSALKKKIDYKIDENGCFNCISHKPCKGGYPQITYNRTPQRLHRFIFKEMFGEIPEGLVVRHKCDNRVCINPEHLELGTIQDNNNDRITRGRTAKGEKAGNSRLKQMQVVEIKKILASNKVNHDLIIKIASDYSVHENTIYDIYCKRTWKHVLVEEVKK